MPNFDQVATALYTTHAFSINNLVAKTNLQPQLTIDQHKTTQFKELLRSKLNNDKPYVLLHPKASSDLRALPNHIAAKIVHSLIAHDLNVVSAFPHNNAPEGFVDVSSFSNSIDDLMHIVDAVDGVISVGTVTYHLAAALGKPTVLLPTVWPDIRSADLLPEVSIHLHESKTQWIQNLHKSNDPTEITTSLRLWQALNSDVLSQHVKMHMSSFKLSSSGYLVAPSAPARVCVFLICDAHKVPSHLDRLIAVDGVDALYTHVLEPECSLIQQSDVIHAKVEFNKAEFVWFVSVTESIRPDSLVNNVAKLESNTEALVGENSNRAHQLDNVVIPVEQLQNYLESPADNGAKS
jgi:hypothetical protein